jgi:hypothetical protein
VSLAKRFSLLCALVAIIIVVGLSVSGEAQVHRGRTVVVADGGFYYANPFWYGYPWLPYGSGYAYQYPVAPYPYGYRFAEPDSAVRLEITPKEAEVYVDGYYAGVVDDFDGAFQKLTLNGGRHKVELRADGYETTEFDVLITPEQTVTFSGDMKKVQ